MAVGDINNDGHSDLYVTNYGANVLYHNRGNDRFADTTQAAGVGGDQYSASAAFFDYDRDGDLDLYVANYVVFDAENLPAEPPLCTFFSGLQVYCGPKGLVGAPDVLYRNEGDGVFTDVTQASGVAAANRYYGLGVVPVDYDGDGDSDLFVANDETPTCSSRTKATAPSKTSPSSRAWRTTATAMSKLAWAQTLATTIKTATQTCT